MTQEEHVRHWVDTSAHNWEGAQTLVATSLRPALVFAHWTLEKLSKALWVQQHANAMPPATDDVTVLLAATSFTLNTAQTTFAHQLKAYHDDVLEPDPTHPLPIPDLQTLNTQADAMRR
ncbi:hypothetical protein GCM10022408_06180 [Hymenobacter fastidiosus]|uniref:HEPN domain-containing protein n=1 Tax=Hymenobacter fastidiosus TaxID=486264 RepID=A0ABP7RIT9_9BACT